MEKRSVPLLSSMNLDNPIKIRMNIVYLVNDNGTN